MNDWQGIFPQGPLPYQLPGGGDYVNQVSHRLGLLAGLADPRNWQRAMTSFPDPRTEAGRAFGKGLMGGQEGAQGLALDWGVNPMGLAGVPNLLGIFKGMNANLSDAERDMLAKAFEMEQAGAGREAIRQATNPPGGSGGWIRAPWDKKWMMEMDDSRMGIHVPENLEEAGMLPEFVSHPQAMEAYPQFKNLALQFGDDTGGMYKSGIVTTSPFENARSVTLHEMQHPIQGWEGMARGGSPEDFAVAPSQISAARQIKDDTSRGADLAEYLSAKGVKNFPLGEAWPGWRAQEAIKEFADWQKISVDEAEGALYNLVSATGELNKAPAYEVAAKIAQEASKKYDDLLVQSILSPEENYRRLAGEALPRLVQARRDLTPAQRLAIDPIEQMDTMLRSEGILGGIDDLIVRYGDGPAMSQSTPTVNTLFAAEALEDAKNLANKWKSRETVINMTPDDFLRMAEGLPEPDAEKMGKVRSLVKSGTKFESLPFINFSNDDGIAKVVGHEGRHRALVLKELGIKEMPVIFRSTDGRVIRWSEQTNPQAFDRIKKWPSVLKAERGDQVMPFPVVDPLSSPAKQQGLLADAPTIPDELPFGYPERIEAFRKAREHAALPAEQGGLGLGPANTAAERMKAGGYDVDFQHGAADDFRVIDPEKLQRSDHGYMGRGLYGGKIGLNAYAENYAMPLKMQSKGAYIWNDANWSPNSGPYVEMSERIKQLGFDRQNQEMKNAAAKQYADEMMSKGYHGVIDSAGNNGDIAQVVVYDPARIRSRFAAFDPFKRNESDLLASWLLPAAGMGLLGLGYLGQGEQTY